MCKFDSIVHTIRAEVSFYRELVGVLTGTHPEGGPPRPFFAGFYFDMCFETNVTISNIVTCVLPSKSAASLSSAFIS